MTAATCQHHWVIEPAGQHKTRGISRGVCQACGAEQDFKNYTDDNPFRIYRSPGQDDLSRAMDQAGHEG